MYVYLDESGDTGFRLGEGSSRFFVVGFVVVDTPQPLEAKLQALRAQMHAPDFEFKFGRMSDVRRSHCLQAICTERFNAYCRVIDKGDMLARRAVLPEYRSREGFYGHVVRRALRDVASTLVAATFVIDESFQSKKEKVRFSTALRQELGGPVGSEAIIGDIQYRQSRREDLIQVTDMVTGAVAHAFETGKDQFKKLIPPHKLDVGELKL